MRCWLHPQEVEEKSQQEWWAAATQGTLERRTHSLPPIPFSPKAKCSKVQACKRLLDLVFSVIVADALKVVGMHVQYNTIIMQAWNCCREAGQSLLASWPYVYSDRLVMIWYKTGTKRNKQINKRKSPSRYHSKTAHGINKILRHSSNQIFFFATCNI